MVARRALAATKVSLVGKKAAHVVVEDVLDVVSVLEQCLGNFRTESGGCTTQIGGCKVD